MSLCPYFMPTSLPGAKTSQDCQFCLFGYSCYAGKASTLCPIGYKRISEYKDKIPYDLVFGNYSRKLSGGWSKFSCVPCQPGEYCKTGAVDEKESEETDVIPLPCPAQTVNNFKAQSTCQPCNIGLGENCV